MTLEEHVEVAGEELQKLIKHQKNRIFGIHNMEQDACNDTNDVLASMSCQVHRTFIRSADTTESTPVPGSCRNSMVAPAMSSCSLP